MARKATQAPPQAPRNDWYLRDWMKTLRVKQAELARRTGMSVATINDIYHGKTSYYRAVLNDIADALHVQPFELLMHPEDAMAMRQLRMALRVVEGSPRLAAADEEVPIAAGVAGRGL